MVTLVEMWSQIDIGCRTKREVIMIYDKLRESENLVAATTEAVGVEARKWFEISASSGTTRPSRIHLEGSHPDSDI